VLASSKKRGSDFSESFALKSYDKKLKSDVSHPSINNDIVEQFKEIGPGLNKWEYELEAVHNFNEDQLVDCLSLKGIYSTSDTFPDHSPKEDIVKQQARIGWELSYRLRTLIKNYPNEFRAYRKAKTSLAKTCPRSEQSDII
jgi:hypothetical protein